MNLKSAIKLLRNILKFSLENYFISLFIAAVAFVGIVSAYRLFFSKPTYVYAKAKVSQGLWWAATAKPPIWLVKAIKKGDVETDLVGKPIVEVLSVRSYPWWGSDQFDVYLTLRLKVSKNKKTGKYNFKRSALGVASPIELEFSSVQLSGTVTELSDRPFEEHSIEKTLTLTKKYAYPWEFDAIHIGDSYFDGEETVFTIVDKAETETRTLTEDLFGNYPVVAPEQKRYIVVRARIKAREINGQLFLGPEQKLNLGKSLNFSTETFTFQDYIIGAVE